MANKTKIIKDGEEKVADIIATFRIPEYDKEYVLYTFGDKQKDNIKILASTLEKKDGNYILNSIAKEEEWTAIKEIIRDLAKKE